MSNNDLRLMQGNRACVEGAIAAGMMFYAGYPITPSTEIAEISAEMLPLKGGKFIQMEDEIAGMAAAIGGSLAGLKSMTATSGPGFSLKQENIGYACLTEIPVVIVNVMRGGPSTGLPTAPAQGDLMQAKWGTHGDHPVIALCPNSVKETFDLTIKAFNLAEELRTPVILLLDEVVGHMRESIRIPEPEEVSIVDRNFPTKGEKYIPFKPDSVTQIPKMGAFGDGHRFHVTGLMHDEYGFPSNKSSVADELLRRVCNKTDLYRDKIVDFESFHLEDAEIVIVAYGCTSRSVKKAVIDARKNGVKAGMFRPISVWPFPDKELIELSKKAKKVIVPEMNLGQMSLEVERLCSKYVDVQSFGKVNGEIITPQEVESLIKEAI